MDSKELEYQRVRDVIDDFSNSDIKVLYHIGVGPKPHCEAEAFRDLWPSIAIYGFEPNPHVYMDRYMEYEGHLLPLALWSSPCFKELLLMGDSMAGSSLLKPHEDWDTKGNILHGKALVYSITLDSFDEYVGNPDDIFLWMDIEGSEMEVLKGGVNTLERVRYIDLEVSHETRRVGEPTEDEITSFLDNFGIKKIREYGKTKTFKSVIYGR